MTELALPRQCCGTCKHWSRGNGATGSCQHEDHRTVGMIGVEATRLRLYTTDMSLCSKWEQAD